MTPEKERAALEKALAMTALFCVVILGAAMFISIAIVGLLQ